jgi:DNA repair exonuclease SbcCD ATPase subunit
MRLRRLQLTGFRHFETFEIAFTDGLNVITGGNGAGKSTLLEAVTWALHGSGAARRSEASLRGLAAPADVPTRVELHFDVAADACRVVRVLTPDGSVAELFEDERCIATGDDVPAAVAKLLGADRETMLHACATGRRELQQLTQLTPAERLRLLSRLLGYRPAARDSPLDDALRALEQELADADERMHALTSAPELLAQLTTELEALQPELAAVDALEERLHEEWSQKRQDVATKLAGYRTRGDELRQQIDRLAGEGAAARCPTCSRPLGSALDGMLERLDDEAYVNAQDTKWLAQRQQQLAQKPPDLLAAETKRRRLRSAVDDRRERAARCEQAAQELWTVAGERTRTAERLRLLRQDVRGARPAGDAVATASSRPGRAELLAVSATASEFVNVVTAGGYEAIVLHEDGRVHALRHGTEVPVVSGGDEEMIALALRLATMRARSAALPRLRLLLLDEPFAGMDADRRHRAVVCLRTLLPAFPQIVLCTRDAAAGAAADRTVRL